MFELRQYKAADALDIIQQRASQPGLELGPMIEQWAAMKESRGPALTGLFRDRIIGCGGLEIMWPGCAEGWCLFTDDIDKYTNHVAKAVKVKLYEWIDEYKLVRIQAPLRADFPAAVRFTSWLGFSHEATLRKYHPDQCDALMYSIVKGDE